MLIISNLTIKPYRYNIKLKLIVIPRLFNVTKTKGSTYPLCRISFRRIPNPFRQVPNPFGEAGFGETGFGEVGFSEAGFGEVGFGEAGFAGFGEVGFGEAGGYQTKRVMHQFTYSGVCLQSDDAHRSLICMSVNFFLNAIVGDSTTAVLTVLETKM